MIEQENDRAVLWRGPFLCDNYTPYNLWAETLAVTYRVLLAIEPTKDDS